MKTGKLFIISGPSGVGKGTIIKELLKEIPQIHLAISATTREKREGEIDKTHYYFLPKEIFKQYEAEDKFLESCLVHEHLYGTLKEEVLSKIEKGQDVLIEIDTQGARKIKKTYPNCIRIFLEPPSLESLKERLINRGTENKDKIEIRLKKFDEEMNSKNEFDHTLINAKIEETVHKLKEIMLQ